MTPSAPLTPSDCNLQDFAFMPLDVARLRDSDLAANETPEACWAAVLLWAASWHQIPAGSIPNDDKWIAKHAGYASRGKIDKAWNDVRDGAMRGFIECTDGRLYHVVVAEKAREAWQAKIEQRYRTEVSRVKKHNQRHKTEHTVPDFEAWLSLGRPSGHYLFVPGDNGVTSRDTPGDTTSKRQGEGQGQGQGDSSSVPEGTGGKPPKPAKTPEEMAKAELWRAAVSVLENGGCPISQCRTFMGKLVVDYDFPIVKEAVAAAVTAQPADAREYLKATCMRLKGERKPKPNTATERRVETLQGLAGNSTHTGETYGPIEVQARVIA